MCKKCSKCTSHVVNEKSKNESLRNTEEHKKFLTALLLVEDSNAGEFFDSYDRDLDQVSENGPFIATFYKYVDVPRKQNNVPGPKSVMKCIGQRIFKLTINVEESFIKMEDDDDE